MTQWKSSLDNVPSGSVLVSTPYRQIIRFHCPVKATCRTPIAGIKEGETVFVDGVYHDENNPLLYLIDGLKLPHTNFNLNS